MCDITGARLTAEDHFEGVGRCHNWKLPGRTRKKSPDVVTPGLFDEEGED